jgi:flagellar biogenesis protein FliO
MTTETLPFTASPWWLRTRTLWQRMARLGRRAPRSLRLRETLPLGEHRFVAVIEFESRRLLIGGTPSSLVLLAQLDSDPSHPGFAEARSAETEIEERRLKERSREERRPPERAEARKERAEARKQEGF